MKYIKLFEQFIGNVNESAFSRVTQYFKKESPDTKVVIKKANKKKQNAKFGGIVYDIQVNDYKTTYTAYDGSTQEDNNLIRTIGAIIDDYSSYMNESLNEATYAVSIANDEIGGFEKAIEDEFGKGMLKSAEILDGVDMRGYTFTVLGDDAEEIELIAQKYK